MQDKRNRLNVGLFSHDFGAFVFPISHVFLVCSRKFSVALVVNNFYFFVYISKIIPEVLSTSVSLDHDRPSLTAALKLCTNSAEYEEIRTAGGEREREYK